ncbi:collagen alpha-1(XV) chain-like [Eupeodes corollae]|uniref:collagen alpha-1(XV) chain-like n=1 Tax=Eupeodes corollae TaxID=290404 RepID=UPI002492DD30|nr:collagen alpha-1(XV) chain-like [Eupeodes corollae]
MVNDRITSSSKHANVDYNLLGAVKDLIGVDFVEGSDSFPAFEFTAMSDIKDSYRLHLPEKLYEFAITTIFRPVTRTGGYLFSIVNPEETIVQLGIHLSPATTGKWNITLLYTNWDSTTWVSKKLATFEIPYSNNWQTVAFKILSDQVTFYHNCIETTTVMVKREPIELIFDSASTLYIGQAGPRLKGHFETKNPVMNTKRFV